MGQAVVSTRNGISWAPHLQRVVRGPLLFRNGDNGVVMCLQACCRDLSAVHDPDLRKQTVSSTNKYINALQHNIIT